MADKISNSKRFLDESIQFKPAQFPKELWLPSVSDKCLKDASDAVKHEYRDCSKWKRLKCRKVSVIAEGDRGIVFIVHVGSSVEFDWTWEGAVAFRPQSLDDRGIFDDFDLENDDYSNQIVWSGEILEVDEKNGCLFISLANPEAIPVVGSFFVRPFEFLGVLNSVYHDDKFAEIRGELANRLGATEGGVHPAIEKTSLVGQRELQKWWQHSWSVLWGPPGTGKTFTAGQQIAGVMHDQTERVLAVSTTNRATDAVALSLGNAAREKCPQLLENGQLVRIGKGASYQSFLNHHLPEMLQGTESEILARIDALAKQLHLFDSWEDKALTRKQIGELRTNSADQSKRIFVDPDVRVVVATAFKAMSFVNNDSITKMIENGDAPFTTIFIDEAGLISRAAIAVLSLLASRRVVLVGDSKQLAPISRISRILPTRQATWLASSGLSHLDEIDSTPKAVHVLSEQRRMHPDVCNVVSEFQYDGFLTTAEETKQRHSDLPSLIEDYSRAIWYVLDEEDADLSSIRARRGPGNRSWVRSITPHILKRLFLDEGVKNANGLFISPYKAQAQHISKLLARWGAKNWEASTVHSQQGSEADIVVFDTVNAGSYNWPFDEWKRLVNVALSRAREAIIVLASRSEMEEPYLRPLVAHLKAGVLARDGSQLKWQAIGNRKTGRYQRQDFNLQVKETKQTKTLSKKNNIGDQIATRKSLRPVLSQEQQRLSNLDLDGKPRLVRGVAGSGKSIVLANWLAKIARKTKDKKDFRIWAVYANRSLHKLLQESIEAAWRSSEEGRMFGQTEFPWDIVSLLHVKDVLAGILPGAGLSMDEYQFDYDRAAEEFLNRQNIEEILPRCNALFIDEAQDMGPATLKLLLSLVEQTDTDDDNSRPAHIFFDNAQNIYGRGTPKWSEFGLDMRGRSTIMRESFRSTNPITELAVNVLDRLAGDTQSQEKRELLNLGLIERCQKNKEEWLRVRFNQVHGPKPIFHLFKTVADEMDAIGNHLIHIIAAENVSPTDICIIYNGKPAAKQIEMMIGPKLANLDVELSFQTNRPFQRQANTVVVTTSHSFKGYDAEVVFIPCADQFVAGSQVLSNNLYVAMTRARSLLAIYSQESTDSSKRKINNALQSCIEALNSTSEVEKTSSHRDDFYDVLELIGKQHRKWLLSIWESYEVSQESIFDNDGNVIAQPLFWFKKDGRRIACFVDDPKNGDENTDYRSLNIFPIQIGAELK